MRWDSLGACDYFNIKLAKCGGIHTALKIDAIAEGAGWYFAPAAVWLWNIWDAFSLARGRGRPILIPLLFGLVAAYGIGWQMVGVDFKSASMERAAAVLRPMLHPDMFQKRQELNRMWTPLYVPCSATEAIPTASRED